MWLMVCRWPQSQESNWAKPHLCKLARHRPWLSGNGSSETMYDEGDWNLAVSLVGSVTIVWLTSEADDQSSLHCVRPIVSTDSAGASKQRGGKKSSSGHMARAEDRDAGDVEEMGNGEGVYISSAFSYCWVPKINCRLTDGNNKLMGPRNQAISKLLHPRYWWRTILIACQFVRLFVCLSVCPQARLRN